MTTLPAADRVAPSARLAAAAPVIERIGATPLLDLGALLPAGAGVRLLAKAEFCNPGGSVKDRPALFMLRHALLRGLFDDGARVLDATSGNTGIAYAMLGAALGIGVTLCVPNNASPERRRLLLAYGAEVLATDPREGSDGASREARRLAAERAGEFVYLDQYGNEQNWRAHFATTGPEIWEQSAGTVTHFVTGLGTSGTFLGVGRFLRRCSPQVRLISVQPDGPLHGLEGMKHMESALVPPIYDPTLADEERSVATELAYATTRRLARELGIAVGISAGANVAAALEVARAIDRGVVVTVLCDDATKYLSDRFWEQP